MMQLAWKRLKNRRSQNAITVLSVFFCISIVFFLTLLWRGFSSGLEISHQRLGSDLVVVPQDAAVAAEVILFGGAPANIYMSKDIADRIREVPGVERVTPQFFAFTLSEGCCDVGESRLIGFDPQSDWVIKPWLAASKLNGLADDEIILGSKIDSINQGSMTVLGKSFRIAGVLEQTGTSLDRSLIINLAEARNLVEHNKAVPLQSLWEKEGPPEGLISAVLVKVDEREDAWYVAQRIKKLGRVDVIIASDLIKKIGLQYQTILGILTVLSLLVVAGTLVQLILRFYSISLEHRLEWGLYQALGAKGYQVAVLLVLEALILTGAGAALGLAGGYGVFSYVESFILNDQSFPFVEPVSEYYFVAGLGLIVISLLFGGLASSLPAYRSSRIEPGAVMQRGEYD